MKHENIKIHYSLLPAFDCEEPMREAFTAGVKVSGVTILDTVSGKILAQYPVLISHTTHFDEFEEEMLKTGEILYKHVIKCIEEDKVFDFSDLFGGCSNGGCGGNCSGNCGGCAG